MKRAEASYDEALFGGVDADIFFDDDVAPSVAVAPVELAYHCLAWATTPGQLAAVRFELGIDGRKASEIARELRISQPRFHQLRKKARAHIDRVGEAVGGA